MKIDLYPNSKSFTVLYDFVLYCNANPELRFWQALLNWSGQGFILFSNNPPDDVYSGGNRLVDPYYFTGKDA